MPRYISKDGTWYPQKEKVGLVNRSGGPIVVDGKEIPHGDPYIYEGVDRQAALELFQAGVETFGQDFKKNPEFLQSIRNQGFDNVDKYLKFIGYDKMAVEERFNKIASKLNKHEAPEKVKMIERMGGGTDTSGQGNNIPGGFGTQPKVE